MGTLKNMPMPKDDDSENDRPKTKGKAAKEAPAPHRLSFEEHMEKGRQHTKALRALAKEPQHRKQLIEYLKMVRETVQTIVNKLDEDDA
jgi:hypothetical protein